MQLAIFLLLLGAGLYCASVLITIAGPNKISQSAASMISFFLPSLAFARISGHAPVLYYLGFRKVFSFEVYFLTIVGIVSAFPVAIWLSEINQELLLPEFIVQMEQDAAKQTQALLQGKGVSTMLVNIVVMAFIPSVCEEVCFRGVLQRLAVQSLRPWLGIIVTSLFFTAIHLQFQGFLPRFFFSVVIGAIYYYTGSIWTSIIAHFITNAIQVLAVSYGLVSINQNTSSPFLLSLAGSFVVLITLLRMKQLPRVGSI